MDVVWRDIGSFVDDAKQALAGKLQAPPGDSLHWTGQYAAMEREVGRLRVVAPVTLLLVFLLLWLDTRSFAKSMIALLARPRQARAACLTRK